MTELKYNAPQIDHLAAEYVLGTLHGGARRRFDRLITDRADVRMAVWRWERYLNGFAIGIEAHRPHRRIWQKIQDRINPSQRKTASPLSWWRGLGWALPVAVAAAWLAVNLLPTPGADRMAVFSDESAAALWVISADLDKRVLKTESVNAEASASDSSYELWLLPAAGPPLSLGLLRVDAEAIELPLSAQLADALENESSLAISLEPAGGSPTGLPTGPVLYQASLVSI